MRTLFIVFGYILELMYLILGAVAIWCVGWAIFLILSGCVSVHMFENVKGDLDSKDIVEVVKILKASTQPVQSGLNEVRDGN